MNLSKRAFGISIGLIWGLYVLCLTWWLLIFGSPGTTISKLDKIYIGYSYSWGGALVGFIWGFIDGFICGFLIAWFYNIFGKRLYKSRPAS